MMMMSLTHALMEGYTCSEERKGHIFRLQRQPSLLRPLMNNEMVLGEARMGILEDHGQGDLEGIILWSNIGPKNCWTHPGWDQRP